VAGVGSFLTARYGALRAAKAALATAKIPRRSAPRGFQTGSKMLMVRHFNCGLSMSAVIATFLHFFRQIAYRGLGTARGL